MSDFINDNQQVTHYDPVAERTAAESQAKQEAPKQESVEERNWKQIREENERIKRESEDLKRQLEAARGDDDLVEQRHLKAAINRIQNDNLDLRLKSKFPDFDQVVNTAALKKLAQDDPEMAYTLDSTQDMYAKAVTAYKMIKANAPRQTEYSEDDDRFEENMFKPRSTNSINPGTVDRPLSQANAFQRSLSKEAKQKYYNEMQEAIRNQSN